MQRRGALHDHLPIGEEERRRQRDASTLSAAASAFFAASIAAAISLGFCDLINRKLHSACARRILLLA
jgi:hypothetical protein